MNEQRSDDGQVRQRVTRQVLIENVVQALARDLLAHQCLAIEELGYRVVFTRHDEVIVEAPACQCPSSHGTLSPDCPLEVAAARVSLLMNDVPASLPQLRGLVVASKRNLAVKERFA